MPAASEIPWTWIVASGCLVAALVVGFVLLWLYLKDRAKPGDASKEAAGELLEAEEARAEAETLVAEEEARDRIQGAQDGALKEVGRDRDLGDVLHSLGAGEPTDGDPGA